MVFKLFFFASGLFLPVISYLETQWEIEKNGGALIDKGEKPLKTLGLPVVPDVPACGLLVPKECSLEATGIREVQDLHSSLSSALVNVLWRATTRTHLA